MNGSNATIRSKFEASTCSRSHRRRARSSWGAPAVSRGSGSVRETRVSASRACRGAAGARPEDFTGEILLVDVDAAALEAAGREVDGARTLEADLGDPEDVAKLATELKGKGTVVTCFEVIEHLETFVPLVEMLESLK